MRVLIHFDPGRKKDNFAGTRLRKSLKNALELNNVQWVDSVYAFPDVAHLISPLDDDIAKYAKNEGIPVVVSALYSEEDPSASFLMLGLQNHPLLTPKARRLIDFADLVLVPSAKAKEIIEEEFPFKRIEIITPGVNPLRFDFADAASDLSFVRYQRFAKEEKYYLTIGNYADFETIKTLITIARFVPQSRFFFLGGGVGSKASPLKTINKKTPANLSFLPIIDEDLYCSALKNASGYLLFDSIIENSMAVLEAFASKTPVFHIGNLNNSDCVKSYPDIIKKFNSVEETINFLTSFDKNTYEETIMKEYEIAERNNLSILGKKLIDLYKSLILKEDYK